MTRETPGLRSSIAAIALIRREQDGENLWLAQWNNKWQCYSFIGGHKRPNETFRECLVREVREELSLVDGSDAFVAQQPDAHLEYTAWSGSAKQQTQYTIELYDVKLGDEALRSVENDARNRWLTLDEIQRRQCRDSQPVSETILELLQRTGLTEPSQSTTLPKEKLMDKSQIEVVVTLIRTAEHKLLLIYNKEWGAFTLPMTKLRMPEDANDPHAQEAELPIDAAARNIVDCLGRLSCPRSIVEDAIPEERLPEQRLSLREKKSKLYRYRVFEEKLRPNDVIATSMPWVWLTPDEIIKHELHPISPTASALVAYDEIMKEIASWK